jgi:hypothetical protein
LVTLTVHKVVYGALSVYGQCTLSGFKSSGLQVFAAAHIGCVDILVIESIRSSAAVVVSCEPRFWACISDTELCVRGW